MLSLKTVCFALFGAIICTGIAFVLSFPVLIVIGGILEGVFGVDEVAWYGFVIVPAFTILGLPIGAFYGAVFALRTRGYSLREYGRTIWAFLNNV